MFNIQYSISNIADAARKFIEKMDGHTVFAFYGGMGAGKTTFIKALCQELGVTDDAVASPTFAIVNEYAVNCQLSIINCQFKKIYHFDFYRIKRLEEAQDMGFDDYLYSGQLCFIEWPELIEPLLPEDAVRVEIKEQPDGTRTISL